MTPNPKDEKILWLVIEDYRCRCGHVWTHSRVRHIHGGTPAPLMEDQNWCEGYSTSSHLTSHCYRCVPLQLGIGWTEYKAPGPTPPQPKRNLLDD